MAKTLKEEQKVRREYSLNVSGTISTTKGSREALFDILHRFYGEEVDVNAISVYPVETLEEGTHSD